MTEDIQNTDAQERAVTQTRKDPYLLRVLKAQVSGPYLPLSPALLLWIFVLASLLGLLIEDVFHLLLYHAPESRAGLVWGPFSSIYGVGAVILTVALNRFCYTHNIFIFLLAMVLGSCLEYFTSWAMEVFWHAIAWDYSGTFGSIDGRTNFLFGVMWGCLGLFWVRAVMPFMRRCIDHVDFKATSFKIISAAIGAFMAVDIAVTILAVHRQGERAESIPADGPIDEILDQAFPDEWLEARFENMTVASDLSTEKTGINLTAPNASQ